MIVAIDASECTHKSFDLVGGSPTMNRFSVALRAYDGEYRRERKPLIHMRHCFLTACSRLFLPNGCRDQRASESRFVASSRWAGSNQPVMRSKRRGPNRNPKMVNHHLKRESSKRPNKKKKRLA